jgi:hypothetical protein
VVEAPPQDIPDAHRTGIDTGIGHGER